MRRIQIRFPIALSKRYGAIRAPKELLGEHGHLWTRATVHQVLTNPKYIGDNIYHRRSFKLKHTRINNPVDMWIWREGAFVPIVDAAIFEQAWRIPRLISGLILLERRNDLIVRIRRGATTPKTQPPVTRAFRAK